MSRGARGERDARGERADRGSVLIVALLLISAALVVVIITGTAWALANRSSPRGANLRSGASRNPSASQLSSGFVDGKAIFSDIGTLRIPVARAKPGDVPATLVLTPFLPYPANDIAFREELVSKNRSIRAAIRSWFTARPLSEIESLGEAGVKEALLAEINGLLVLGRVEAIYFTDYMALD